MSLAARWIIGLGVGLGLGQAVALGKPKAGDDDPEVDDDVAKGFGGAAETGREPTTSEVPVDDGQSEFEKARFFLDKIADDGDEDKTLVQGNLTSTTFGYREHGGDLGGPLGATGVTNASPYQRLFSDVRAQLDGRHIAGGRWALHLDTRARVATDPGNADGELPGRDYGTRTQSGLFGDNEYELRELWLQRSGDAVDLQIGRQVVGELAATKVDGLRLDWAKSHAFTLVGFAGAHPARGSRSLTTDYPDLQDETGRHVGRTPPITAGLGGVYRTGAAYGSIGVVTIAPIHAETPRVFLSDSGYLRTGTLDIYHLAVIDVHGVAGAGVTNLSVGVNWHGAERVRFNAAYNRVDVETLNVVAQTYLAQPDTSVSLVQNDVEVRRIASNEARTSLSVGLGRAQRFEIGTQLAYRFRPSIDVTNGDGTDALTIGAAKGVEAFFTIVDRHFPGKLRLGLDVSRTFGVGSVAYDRNEAFASRLYATRELGHGKASLEAEVGYATAKDQVSSAICSPANFTACYGTSSSKTTSAGGTLYVRLTPAWFAIGSLFVGKQALSATPGGAPAIADPTLTSTSGFLRIGYRF